MMNDTNPHEWDQKLGTGEGQAPLAKPPMNVNVRTMASDAESLKETGGGVPRPYTPKPPQDLPFAPSSAPTPPRSVYTPPPPPPIPPVPPSRTPSPSSSSPVPPPIPPKPSQKKKYVMWIVIALVVIGVWAVVYALSPFFSSQNNNESALPENPAPISSPETGTPEKPPLAPPESEVITSSFTHVSLFRIAPTLTSEVNLDEESLTALKNALRGNTTASPVTKEVVVKGSNLLLESREVLPLLLPTVFTSQTADAFQNDFTLFTYADAGGVWPGILIKASSSDLTSLQNTIRTNMESGDFSSLQNFYLSSPGTPGTWKQGRTGTVLNRYLVFTNASLSVSLNYAWIGNTLLISSSYDGFKEALRKL